MAKTVTVLGSANVDLMTRAPRRALPGETLTGTGFALLAGGKGLNQAIAAARAGAHVAFLGCVGRDAFGPVLREALRAEHIDTSGLRDASEPTGVAQITVTDGGENSIVVIPGANSDAEFSDSDKLRIAGSTFLLLQLERPMSLVRSAAAFAKSRSIPTILTPAPAASGDPVTLPPCDILVPNEVEAAQLSGEVDAHRAAAHLSRGIGTVIVTCGAAGAVVAQRGAVRFDVPAYPAKVVDTTGAGDAFVGILAARLAALVPLREALRVASRGAAITVGAVGASASLPSREQLL